jgi:hypothetical protein
MKSSTIYKEYFFLLIYDFYFFYSSNLLINLFFQYANQNQIDILEKEKWIFDELILTFLQHLINDVWLINDEFKIEQLNLLKIYLK